MNRKPLLIYGGLLAIGCTSLTANIAQAFDMNPGRWMNPSRWFGGNRDRGYDDHYGGPGYGYGGGPGYGYGGAPGYGYGGAPGYGYGGAPGYGNSNQGYGNPNPNQGYDNPNSEYSAPSYGNFPAEQGMPPVQGGR
jgi:hypothetical protein